jgi:acyl dehydratase
MIDRAYIGVVSEPRVIDVEKGQLKFFARATGTRDPIYFDEAAAGRAGHRALPAPPTFLFSLGLGAPAKRGDLFTDMCIDVARILHGEQSFRYHQPIYAGDRITLVTQTVDIFEKKGGALEFVVQETRATNQHGELCASMRIVTVVRNG